MQRVKALEHQERLNREGKRGPRLDVGSVPRKPLMILNGHQIHKHPLTWRGSKGLPNNSEALTALAALANSFPLAQTVTDVSALCAIGTGGIGGGLIYQLIYPIQGQANAAAGCIAFQNVFNDLSHQDELLRIALNSVIQSLQIL